MKTPSANPNAYILLKTNRFKAKVIKNKKAYNRKEKHKKEDV